MTPHNSAKKGSIAKTVLLPGDPSRASWVAHNFLISAKEVTDIRGMKGYTGLFNNIEVTVMASGMGGPSMGIYSYELFTHYDVDSIIRIGTSGGLNETIEVGDIVLALSASTDSNFSHQYNLRGTYSPIVDYSLFQKAVQCATNLCIPYHAGMVFSSDLFSSYNALGEDSWKPWARMGALVQDMETHALHCTSAFTKKKALSILTMTDSCVTGIGLIDDKRMSALEPMVTLALHTATTSH